jgi:large subunit ribosomal protein L30
MTSPSKPRAGKSQAAGRVSIRLVRSPIGNTYHHKATIAALGLRHLNQVVVQEDTPQLRGMLAKVAHLVTVEAAPSGKEKAQ